MRTATAFAGVNVQSHLDKLGLSRERACRLLAIAPRTLSRYIATGDVPGAVVQCLLAWQILKDADMPWPGAVSRYYTKTDDGSFVLADPQPTPPKGT